MEKQSTEEACAVVRQLAGTINEPINAVAGGLVERCVVDVLDELIDLTKLRAPPTLLFMSR